MKKRPFLSGVLSFSLIMTPAFAEQAGDKARRTSEAVNGKVDSVSTSINYLKEIFPGDPEDERMLDWYSEAAGYGRELLQDYSDTAIAQYGEKPLLIVEKYQTLALIEVLEAAALFEGTSWQEIGIAAGATTGTAGVIGIGLKFAPAKARNFAWALVSGTLKGTKKVGSIPVAIARPALIPNSYGTRSVEALVRRYMNTAASVELGIKQRTTAKGKATKAIKALNGEIVALETEAAYAQRTLAESRAALESAEAAKKSALSKAKVREYKATLRAENVKVTAAKNAYEAARVESAAIAEQINARNSKISALQAEQAKLTAKTTAIKGYKVNAKNHGIVRSYRVLRGSLPVLAAITVAAGVVAYIVETADEAITFVIETDAPSRDKALELVQERILELQEKVGLIDSALVALSYEEFQPTL